MPTIKKPGFIPKPTSLVFGDQIAPRPQSTVETLTGDPLLNEAEAAAYLGVAAKTLAVWRCTGRYPLAFVKIGSRVKYRRRDLDAFITARTHAPTVA